MPSLLDLRIRQKTFFIYKYAVPAGLAHPAKDIFYLQICRPYGTCASGKRHFYLQICRPCWTCASGKRHFLSTNMPSLRGLSD